MKNLPLGQGALRSSRLAYGCWRIAPSGDPATDLATARRAVQAAVEAGYTLFDHADIYCDGRAETVFGALLRESPGLRERIVIATKCGIRFADRPPGAPYRYDFSAEYITQQCEQSLRRLGVECIDVYQLHRPDWLMDAEEVAGAFAKLERAGKVREFGVSNFSPVAGRAAAAGVRAAAGRESSGDQPRAARGVFRRHARSVSGAEDHAARVEPARRRIARRWREGLAALAAARIDRRRSSPRSTRSRKRAGRRGWSSRSRGCSGIRRGSCR